MSDHPRAVWLPRPVIALRAFAAAITAGSLAASAACAPITTYNPDHLAPDQIARVGEICHSVVGLPKGNYTQYYACEEGLSQALATRLSSQRLIEARQDCLTKGLHPGTVPLADCELASKARFYTASTDRPDALETPSNGSAGSYFSASNGEVHRRAQRACAQIGYDPVSSGFANCVAGLESSLFDADNPMH